MAARRKHSKEAYMRLAKSRYLPACKKKVDFMIVFLGLFVGGCALMVVAYALVNWAALLLIFMVEKIWPMALVVFMLTMILMNARYGEEVSEVTEEEAR